MATASAGGTTYIIGAAFADTITRHTSMKVIVEPLGRTTLWVPRVGKGEIEFGVTFSFLETADAYYGLGHFTEEGPMDLLVAAAGSLTPQGMFTTSKDVKSFADFKGKRFFGIGTRMLILQSKALSDVYGLQEGDVEFIPYQSIKEVVRAYVERKADGNLYIPGPWIEEVQRSRPVYYVPIPKDVVAKVKETIPILEPAVVPAGKWGATEDVPTWGLYWGLVVNGAVPDETVYTVLQTLYDNYSDYEGVHARLKAFTLDDGRLGGVGQPFHPGAIKYYKEKGLWSAKFDQANQKFLDARKK